MTYIWRAQERRDKIVFHVLKHNHLGHGLNAAICGTPMKFNRSINMPLPNFSHRPRPICKNCLRSCLDQRIAA